jgi:hypothetical protein
LPFGHCQRSGQNARNDNNDNRANGSDDNLVHPGIAKVDIDASDVDQKAANECANQTGQQIADKPAATNEDASQPTGDKPNYTPHQNILDIHFNPPSAETSEEAKLLGESAVATGNFCIARR